MPARFTNTSMLTNITRTMEFDQYTQEEFEQRYTAWRSGKLLIQEAFAELSVNGREFIKTGITHAEWEEAFGDPPVVGDGGALLGR
jgi:hypothetical protein